MNPDFFDDYVTYCVYPGGMIAAVREMTYGKARLLTHVTNGGYKHGY